MSRKTKFYISLTIVIILMIVIPNSINMNKRKSEEGISYSDQLVELQDEKNNKEFNPSANEQNFEQVWYENFEVLFDYFTVNEVFTIEDYISSYIKANIDKNSKQYTLDKNNIVIKDGSMQFSFLVKKNPKDENVTVYILVNTDKSIKSITIVPDSLKQ